MASRRASSSAFHKTARNASSEDKAIPRAPQDEAPSGSRRAKKALNDQDQIVRVDLWQAREQPGHLFFEALCEQLKILGGGGAWSHDASPIVAEVCSRLRRSGAV